MITLTDALTVGQGTWRSFNCPDHDDSTPSARVNSVTGKWICMVCGSRGISQTYDPPEKLVIAQVRRLTTEKTELSEYYLDIFDSAGPGEYWAQRFTAEACQFFRLGYDSAKEKSVYPIRNPKGEVLGVVYRNYPGEKPKYRYPRGITTSELLFNYENVCPGQPVVVVEGAPDVIALWEVGIPAVGTFGARLYTGQQRLLSALEPSWVLVAYDQDRAGAEGGVGAVSSLLRLGIPARRALWPDYNDPGDMDPKTRREIFRRILDKGLTLG